MDKHEFAVSFRARAARVVFSGDAERVGIELEGGSEETEAARAGEALGALMRAKGLTANEVNAVELTERAADGPLVATLRPVLEGARVVWLVLYRADRDASAFRALGSRQRVGEALSLAFEQLRSEIRRPHKP